MVLMVPVELEVRVAIGVELRLSQYRDTCSRAEKPPPVTRTFVPTAPLVGDRVILATLAQLLLVALDTVSSARMYCHQFGIAFWAQSTALLLSPGMFCIHQSKYDSWLQSPG